jgi:hypothetical protein
MPQQSEQTTAERLAAVRGRISRWRSTPHRSKSMPARLWAEAVSLARELGVHRVKSALGLNYASLRTRVDEASAGNRAATGGAFVELSGAQLLGVPPAAVLRPAWWWKSPMPAARE